MKHIYLLAVTLLLSLNAFASEIQGATKSKQLEIQCGDRERGGVRLRVDGTSAHVYVNFSAYETEAGVEERSSGDYALDFANEHLVVLEKDSLQATVYRVVASPYTEVAMKRLDCTWSRR
ncbi:MAG: hypothetical protein KDD37_08340 [Bdellovibrionales bacterium]|nr:hypothetical protein [Bdellovibrionales bacterium]